MILSDRTIQTLLENGTLRILYVYLLGQIQPASVDIRLGDTFSVVEDTSSGIVTLEKEISYKTIRSESYLLLPNQFVLATTMEYVELPDYLTAFVEGRSSLGRMGLLSRMRAGLIPASAVKSRWSSTMQTGVPSS